MRTSSIGVQQILPRTSAGWQNRDPTPEPPSQANGDDAPEGSDRSPQQSGLGEVVDRVA